MNEARFFPVYLYVFGFERLYPGVLVEGFIEHVDADLGRIQYVKRFHYDDIQQSVAH